MIDNKSPLYSELKKLMNLASLNNSISKKTIQDFFQRINENKLIKKDNVNSHFCVFFLPADIKNKKIYLCHHKKANDWIPPGGHIDENELPTQTVIRECKEELSINIKSGQIEFLNLSVKQIKNSDQICKTHFDIWYLTHLKTQPINFLQKEFLDAKWVTISEAKKLIKKNPDFLKIILALQNTHFLV